MTVWWLLAAFIGFYIGLTILAIGVYIGERREARRHTGTTTVRISDRWRENWQTGTCECGASWFAARDGLEHRCGTCGRTNVEAADA